MSNGVSIDMTTGGFPGYGTMKSTMPPPYLMAPQYTAEIQESSMQDTMNASLNAAMAMQRDASMQNSASMQWAAYETRPGDNMSARDYSPDCIKSVLIFILCALFLTAVGMITYITADHMCKKTRCEPNLPPVSVAIESLQDRNCTQVAMIMPESCYENNVLMQANVQHFLQKCVDWLNKLTLTDPSFSAEVFYRKDVGAYVIKIWHSAYSRNMCNGLSAF